MLHFPSRSVRTSWAQRVDWEKPSQRLRAGNAKYDAYASVKGGSRRRKGGNPDWNWGCMSGGKKRKSRKHSRRNKHKKSRKSRTYRKY